MKQSKYFLLLSLITLLAVLFSGCEVVANVQGDAEQQEVQPTVIAETGTQAEGRLVPREYTHLSFKMSGEVAEIFVQEGQNVARGDVLIRLGDAESAQAALTAARLEQVSAEQALKDLNDTSDLIRRQAEQDLTAADQEVTSARKALDDLDTDDFQNRLDDAEVKVDDMKEALGDAQEEFDKYADLSSDNQNRKNAETTLENTQQDYDNAVHDRDVLLEERRAARNRVNLAEAQQADVQRRVDDLQNGPDPDDLRLAEARLDNANAQVAAAEKAVSNLELLAPYQGTVVDIEPSVGEQVQAGALVITFADFTSWYVETKDLTELDVVNVSEGQAVTVEPDALPGLTLNGVVESISSAYTERSGDILYTVRIRLDDSDPRLRWGMTVWAKFQE